MRRIKGITAGILSIILSASMAVGVSADPYYPYYNYGNPYGGNWIMPEITVSNSSDVSDNTQTSAVNYNTSAVSINTVYTSVGNYSVKKVKYSFLDKEKGADIILSDKKFIESQTQRNLDYHLEKNGATLEEYKAFAKEQTRDWSEDEMKGIQASIRRIQKRFESLGFNIPIDGNISFVKTTMKEEFNASGYTLDKTIFIDEHTARWSIANNEQGREQFDKFLIHEMFHVFSRNNPKFRKAMYSVISFEMMDEDVKFSKKIKNAIFANPDVLDFNYYSYFTIDGKKQKAIVVTYLPKAYTKGADAHKVYQAGIVPIEDTTKIYTVSQVPDFWNVMGKNTEYTIAPEECLADNFSFAVVYGVKGKSYSNPETITKIINLLKENY